MLRSRLGEWMGKWRQWWWEGHTGGRTGVEILNGCNKCMKTKKTQTHREQVCKTQYLSKGDEIVL